MNDPKHQKCLDLVKVGDVLSITVSYDRCMSALADDCPFVEEFPVTQIVCNGKSRHFIVISHYNGRPMLACGTLIKIQKKR